VRPAALVDLHSDHRPHNAMSPLSAGRAVASSVQ
jgi:hypothetical protein